MAAVSTPVKRAKCFACLDLHPWRLHLVHGNKWVQESVSDKLRMLVGDATVKNVEKWDDIGVCRGCLLKISNSYDLVMCIKEGVTRLSQCKRSAKTPGDRNIEKKRAKRPTRRRARQLFASPGPKTSTPTKTVPLDSSEQPNPHGSSLDISCIDTTAVSITDTSLDVEPLPAEDHPSLHCTSQSQQSSTTDSGNPTVWSTLQSGCRSDLTDLWNAFVPTQ